MSEIRYQSFPQTEPPPFFVPKVVDAFRLHESEISTRALAKGLTSDEVLSVLSKDLLELGFEVELGKRKDQKIHRPVFFGENGEPTLKYEVDAFHEEWKCGLEVEAGRGWMGNAVYRDLVQAMVMVEVDVLVLAVSNTYKYKSGGRDCVSQDYDHAIRVAETLYGHNRFKLPYQLVVVGY